MIPGVIENGLFIGMSDIVISLDQKNNAFLIERRQGFTSDYFLFIVKLFSFTISTHFN